MKKQFYVYEWFNIDTNEIFYVGKGTKNRINHKKSRNRLFKEYIRENNCNNRIIAEFDNEQEAFEFEFKRIVELKQINQCRCNLDNGGVGGVNFVWTPEMKDYMSKYNPMKSENQKKRMSTENPMKNNDVIKRVVQKKQRAVIIEEMRFESVKSASEYYKVFDTEIITWCKRGYDRNKMPCRYENEKQKNFVLKTTNSKKVMVDDKTFDSVRSAAKYVGVWSESIIRAIKSNRVVKGHIVKYSD